MTQTPFLKTQQMQVGGMDCGSCAKTIEASLQQLPGVSASKVSFAAGRLSVSYDPKLVTEVTIRDHITALGYTIEQAPSKTLEAQVGGMDCGGCAKTIEASLQQLAGVGEASVSFATGRLNVSYDPQQANSTLR